MLAVAGPLEPVIVDGLTGREHARLLLECLALTAGSSSPDLGRLAERLSGLDLPPGPVLAVSTHATNLPDQLAARLHRPVAALRAADLPKYDFYEAAPEPPPAPLAEKPS